MGYAGSTVIKGFMDAPQKVSGSRPGSAFFLNFLNLIFQMWRNDNLPEWNS